MSLCLARHWWGGQGLPLLLAPAQAHLPPLFFFPLILLINIFPRQGLEENCSSWQCRAEFALGGQERWDGGAAFLAAAPRGEQGQTRDKRLQVPLAWGAIRGERRLPHASPPEIGQEPTAGLGLDPELSAPLGACKGLGGQKFAGVSTPDPPSPPMHPPHAHPCPQPGHHLVLPYPGGCISTPQPIQHRTPTPKHTPPQGGGLPTRLHTLYAAFPLPVVSVTAGLQPPSPALPLFQFYELFLAINMVLSAHLSGPAALESACRAAHDRSKLTRMILELLSIPSAPRNAPGSVTRCQAGQPPPLRLRPPCASSCLLSGSSHPRRLGWGPSLPARLAPYGDAGTVSSHGHGPPIAIACPPRLHWGVCSWDAEQDTEQDTALGLFCARCWVNPKR